MTGTIQQFDFTLNLLKPLIWQYENAKNLRSLLQQKQDWYEAEQTEFWTDWQADVFDLTTANAFGLSVWSIILGQPIIFSNISDPSQPTWGFESFHRNFDRGNFSSGKENYVISMETARAILRLRYYKLIGTVQIPAINRALKDIFGEEYGPAYVVDENNMTLRYVFGFVPPSDMQFAFNNFDVLPRPSCVKSTWTIVVELPWGFGPYNQNFNHGNFTDE